MNDDFIKDRIRQIREHWASLEKEVEELQAQCSHPEYEEGLTMVACIQPVLICVNCGHAKPHPGGQGDMATYTEVPG